MREPEDSLIVRSLTRELESDLIAAFEISRPLVDKYRDTFWQSRSYLDFLVQILKLPFHKKYFQRDDFEMFRKPFAEGKNKINILSTNKNAELLKSRQEEVRPENEELELKECQSLLAKYLSELEKCRSELEKCRSELEKCRSELKNSQSELKNNQSESEKNHQSESEKNHQSELEKNHQSELKNNQSLLEKYQSELDKNQSELKKYQLKLKNTQLELENTQSELENTQSKLKKNQEYLEQSMHVLHENYNSRQKEKDDHWRNQLSTMEISWKTQLEEVENKCKNQLENIKAEWFNRVQEFNEFRVYAIQEYEKLYRNLMELSKEKSDVESIAHELMEDRNNLLKLNSNLITLYNKLPITGLDETNNEVQINTVMRVDMPEDESKSLDMETDTCKNEEISLKYKRIPAISFSEENGEDDAIGMDSEEETSIFDNTLIDSLKKFYLTDGCHWKENVRLRLLQDLELLKIFKKQLDELKLMSDLIKVNPEDFASTVLRLYENAPSHLNSLKQIAEAASISETENIVPEMKKRLDFIRELYKPFQDECYEKWVQTFSSKLQRLWDKFIQVDDWLSLYAECEKFAQYFQITLNPTTMHDELNLRIRTILKVITVADTFERQIENFRQNLIEKEEISAQNKNQELNNLLIKWKLFYDRLLEKFQFDSNLDKENFISKLSTVKQEYDDYNEFYEKCLEILKIDYTSKEVFLDRLQEKMNTLKRTHSDSDEREKKRKSETYSLIEIQNLFDALYKEYFHMRWEHYNTACPKETVIIERLKEKLDLLEQIKVNHRLSGLLKILLQYVEMDLTVFTDEIKTFSDIVSKDDLLETTMKTTEKYLEDLMKNK